MSNTLYAPTPEKEGPYKRACEGSRYDLKKCLMDSDCAKKTNKTPRECLRNPEGMVPDQCFALRNIFFECKRSMLDMRTRFRGRKGY